jgi:endonuclease/exonuclease/phosphatase family metal-dependent hydrolase
MGAAAWLRLFALLLVNLIVALLWLSLLAWLLGRVLTDRLAWSQFLWWIPTPAALIVAMLGLLLAFRTAKTRTRRRRMFLWAACTLVLIMHFTLFEHRLLRAAPRVPPGIALTIAHWNMTLGNNAPAGDFAPQIEQLDADVLMLTSPPGEVRTMLVERAAASEGREHVLNAWPMLLHSRLPIMRVSVLVATDLMYVTLVELDATERLGRPIVLYLVDLPSNPRRPRMAIAREVRRLLDETSAAPPDLVIGDFNMTRGSASVATLFPNLIHAFNATGHGYGATFPRRLPLYHIDHVLVNENAGLRAMRYAIIDGGATRHRAQKAWIRSVD